jgi:hypothetical protein
MFITWGTFEDETSLTRKNNSIDLQSNKMQSFTLKLVQDWILANTWLVEEEKVGGDGRINVWSSRLCWADWTRLATAPFEKYRTAGHNENNIWL